MGQPIKKILIANRGEIAIRIMRTCKEMNIQTVSVHSTADENSLHVKLADESVCIGPSKPKLSYLNIPAILSAAHITQADAIHPGFGFLSENEEFAQMCTKWGIRFIGPNAKVIGLMGDKIRSKELAIKANLPVLEPIKIDENVSENVLKMGFPVLIKASAGGGGRGMQKIDHIDQLIPAIERLEQEALSAFGDGTLFIEKYITRPRHVEVQILGDQHGKLIHIGERDCTVQRRFQKIIEESPSPVISEQTRQQMCAAAVNLGKMIGYDSVGTVEFLYDLDSQKFYFMEMNTRIQVEHPVTEMRTGLDLIAHQIESASGLPLSITQDDVHFSGHTMECRINAEDSITCLPAPGKILYYYRPAGIGVRVDDFIYSGHVVSPFYDSMLAKVITWGKDRPSCIKRMQRALNEMIITGISTNIDLHQKILANAAFQSSDFSTKFMEELR